METTSAQHTRTGLFPAVHDPAAVAALLASCMFPGIGSILGIVFARTHIRTARRNSTRISALATAGEILGYLGLALIIAAAIIAVVIIAHVNTTVPGSCDPTTQFC